MPQVLEQEIIGKHVFPDRYEGILDSYKAIEVVSLGMRIGIIPEHIKDPSFWFVKVRDGNNQKYRLLGLTYFKPLKQIREQFDFAFNQ